MEPKKKCIIVRKAILADLHYILANELEVIDEHSKWNEYCLVNKDAAKITAKEIKKAFRSKKFVILVAVINGLIAGYLIGDFRKPNPIYRHKKIFFIGSIFVEKKQRNKKIGSTLLKHAQEIAKNQGASFLNLFVDPHNKNSLLFYEKKGFGSVRYWLTKKVK